MTSDSSDQRFEQFAYIVIQIAHGSDRLVAAFMSLPSPIAALRDNAFPRGDYWRLLRRCSDEERAGIRIAGASILDYILLMSPHHAKARCALFELLCATHPTDALNADSVRKMLSISKNTYTFKLHLPSHETTVSVMGLNCLEMSAACLSLLGVTVTLSFQSMGTPLLTVASVMYPIAEIINGMLGVDTRTGSVEDKNKANFRKSLLPHAVVAAQNILAALLPHFSAEQLAARDSVFGMCFHELIGLLFSVAAQTQKLSVVQPLITMAVRAPGLYTHLTSPTLETPCNMLGWMCASPIGFEDDDHQAAAASILTAVIRTVKQQAIEQQQQQQEQQQQQQEQQHNQTQQLLTNPFILDCMSEAQFTNILARYTADAHTATSSADSFTSDKPKLNKAIAGLDTSILWPAAVATIFGNVGILKALHADSVFGPSINFDMPNLDPSLPPLSVLELSARIGYAPHVKIIEWIIEGTAGKELENALLNAVGAAVTDASRRTDLLKRVGEIASGRQKSVFDKLIANCPADDDKQRLRGENPAAKSSATTAATSTTAAAAAATTSNSTGKKSSKSGAPSAKQSGGFTNSKLKADEDNRFKAIPDSFVQEYKSKHGKKSLQPSVKREIIDAWEKLSDVEKKKYGGDDDDDEEEQSKKKQQSKKSGARRERSDDDDDDDNDSGSGDDGSGSGSDSDNDDDASDDDSSSSDTDKPAPKQKAAPKKAAAKTAAPKRTAGAKKAKKADGKNAKAGGKKDTRSAATATGAMGGVEEAAATTAAPKKAGGKKPVDAALGPVNVDESLDIDGLIAGVPSVTNKPAPKAKKVAPKKKPSAKGGKRT